MNDRIQQAINKIEKSLNETKLNLSKLGLTGEDLAYLFNIEKYKDFFREVKILYLDKNDIEKIEKDAFNGLEKLEELDLSGNKITEIEKDAFNGLKNLEMLDLLGNKLTSLPERIFKSLVNLEWVYLKGNNLTSLPEKIENKQGLQIFY